MAGLVDSIISRVWPDANEAEKARLALVVAEIEAHGKIAQAQNDVNKTEAASGNLFVSGARPAMLWCCVLIFFYSYIVYPTAVFIVALRDADLIVPKLSLDETVWNLIFGLLGLGLIGARSFEKVKGVAR